MPHSWPAFLAWIEHYVFGLLWNYDYPMTHEPAWINRNITRMDRDIITWPAWMKREAELRAEAKQGNATGFEAYFRPSARFEESDDDGMTWPK